MTQEKPKCTRAVLTAMYSDGSSVMLDVKDPAFFDIQEVTSVNTRRWVVVPGYRMDDSTVEYRIRLSPDRPALISTYPLPEEN
jgi:hypothetical protein